MYHSSKVFLAIILVSFSSVGAFSWWIERPAEANGESCAVYQSYYNQLPEKKAAFFEHIAHGYAHFPSDRVPDAPKEFARDTGEFEEFIILQDSKPFSRPVREKFEKDTSEFFDAVAEGKKQYIGNCFDDLTDAPGFYSGPLNLLNAREMASGRDDEEFVSLWSFSPIGFSNDGRSAIMYAGYNCGGLCGWGGFILLEKVDGEWIVAGDKGIWVS